MKFLKVFLEKFYTGRDCRNSVVEIKETLEVSRKDFIYLGLQFVAFGLIPMFIAIITTGFDMHDKDAIILDAVYIGFFIWQFVYFLMKRAQLKKQTKVCNFNLYDAWGYVWFGFGSISVIVLELFEFLYYTANISVKVYSSAAVSLEIINVSIVLIMLLYTGIALKNIFFSAISALCTALFPLIVFVRIDDNDVLSSVSENWLGAYGIMLESIETMKFILFVFYIVIGFYCVCKRKAVENGAC